VKEKTTMANGHEAVLALKENHERQLARAKAAADDPEMSADDQSDAALADEQDGTMAKLLGLTPKAFKAARIKAAADAGRKILVAPMPGPSKSKPTAAEAPGATPPTFSPAFYGKMTWEQAPGVGPAMYGTSKDEIAHERSRFTADEIQIAKTTGSDLDALAAHKIALRAARRLPKDEPTWRQHRRESSRGRGWPQGAFAIVRALGSGGRTRATDGGRVVPAAVADPREQ